MDATSPTLAEQELREIQRQRVLWQRAFTLTSTFIAGLSLGGAMAQLLFPNRKCPR